MVMILAVTCLFTYFTCAVLTFGLRTCIAKARKRIYRQRGQLPTEGARQATQLRNDARGIDGRLELVNPYLSRSNKTNKLRLAQSVT